MAEVAANTPTVEYITTVFTLFNDNLGPNKATLLHARTNHNDGSFYKAILYTHGYSDYFFHDHLCVKFLEQGYDFFALDLRKCGRSIILPEQDRYRHYFTDIHEYDEEITLAIEHIITKAKGRPKKLIFCGHSIGGLIACTYASSGLRCQDIDAVILNSPFIAPLETSWSETVLSNMLMRLGLSVDIPDNGYVRSIHSAHKGEWNFDVQKKTVEKIRIHGPSFRAIRSAQEELVGKGSSITCPILVLCSSRSMKPGKTWCDEYNEADMFFNVTAVRRAASMLGHQITIYEVDKAIHDVFLSKLPVREIAFKLMFQWLKNIEDNWSIST